MFINLMAGDNVFSATCLNDTAKIFTYMNFYQTAASPTSPKSKIDQLKTGSVTYKVSDNVDCVATALRYKGEL